MVPRACWSYAIFFAPVHKGLQEWPSQLLAAPTSETILAEMRPRCLTFEPGARVRVKGLKVGDAHVDQVNLNWKYAQDWLLGLDIHNDPHRMTGSQVSTHAPSQAPSVRCQWRVPLKARPEINGCAGSVVDWDEDECRWKAYSQKAGAGLSITDSFVFFSH